MSGYLEQRSTSKSGIIPLEILGSHTAATNGIVISEDAMPTAVKLAIQIDLDNTAPSSDNIPSPAPPINTKDSFYNVSEIVTINLLQQYRLNTPLTAIIEYDEEGFVANLVDIPIYGTGSDRTEALQTLKLQIEDVYDELMEDDNFSDEWLNYKRFLLDVIETD